MLDREWEMLSSRINILTSRVSRLEEQGREEVSSIHEDYANACTKRDELAEENKALKIRVLSLERHIYHVQKLQDSILSYEKQVQENYRQPGVLARQGEGL